MDGGQQPSGKRRRTSVMHVRVKRDTLEAALIRKNLTKTSFAHLARLHRTYLSDVLADRVSPGPAVRQRILDALGGAFDEYFEIVR